MAIKVKVQEVPGRDVRGTATAIGSVTSHNYPIGGNEGLVFVREDGEAYMLVDNMLDAEVTLPRGAYIGAIERVDQFNEMELEEKDRPIEKGPTKQKATAEKQAYLEEIIRGQTENLDKDTRESYVNLVLQNHDVFSADKFDLGLTTMAEHTITLRDEEPVYVKQYRLAERDRSVLISHLRNWLKLGVVSPCRSKYNSPIFTVPKRDGTLRPVLDFRALNEKSHIDKYSQLEVNECIDSLGRSESKVFSSIDLTCGFWQVPLEEGSRQYTAFTLPGVGSFQWNRTPMGLLGSPATFGRMMEHIMRFVKCICYQDDVLVHSKDHSEHFLELQKCFNRLRAAGLKMNAKKCSFGQAEVAYLGYKLTPDGILPGKEKTAAIEECEPPTSVKQVREFVGLCNYFRASVKNFAQLCGPLNELLRSNSKWKGGELPESARSAFDTLKERLTSPEVLAYPDPRLEYHLVVDASVGSDESEGGMGASLIQIRDGKPRAIGFVSRKTVKHEKNYSAFLLEMAACVFGIQHFHIYLKGRKFFLYTDHRPLEKLSKIHTRTLHRLQQLMNEYQFVIKY